MTTEIEPRASAPAEAPAPGDVVTVLTAQHEQARRLLADLHETMALVAELTGDMAGTFQELVALLSTHEAAEELAVYPTLRTELAEGRLADACLAEEHDVKARLAKLEKMAPTFFAFPDALCEFEARLVAHADHEERAVFPILTERLRADRRQDLGDQFRHAAARAPWHAHAHSPEGVVGNFLFGPVLATIDRVRDARQHRSN